jgi:hypothetical protein
MFTLLTMDRLLGQGAIALLVEWNTVNADVGKGYRERVKRWLVNSTRPTAEPDRSAVT